MEDQILKIFYTSLTSITVAFIGVFIPFSGAYWLYKLKIKASAELRIFEIGREIAEILQKADEIKSPFWGVAYAYIDSNLHRVEETNRDLAISELLKIALYPSPWTDENSDLTEKDRANIFIAIATEQFGNLVPPGVKWSGMGGMYSTYGEKIVTDDQLYPFGTKLYRRWIGDFGLIYNNLWMCVENRKKKVLVDALKKDSKFFEEDIVEKWLENIEDAIKKIMYLHSMLISQIQIIDNIVNEKQFTRNIIFCFIYLLLMGVVGYFVPRILDTMNILSVRDLLLFALGTIALAWIAIYRLFFYTGRPAEVSEIRKIVLPRFFNLLNELKQGYLKYKYSYVENIISLQTDLKLSEQAVGILEKLVKDLKKYNDIARRYTKDIKGLLSHIEKLYGTEDVGTGGMPFPLHKIPSEDYDLNKVCDKISDEHTNLLIEYNEHHSSRTLFAIDSTVLNTQQKADLCKDIKAIRAKSCQLQSFISMKESQKKINGHIGSLERILKNYV